jgi:signal transduction histidine kinase/CheY-like chemotaxis protein
MNFIRFLLLWLYIISASVFAADAPPVFVPNGEQRQSISDYIEYLDDPSGSFSFDDVSSGAAGQFNKLTSDKKLGYNFENKVLWVKFAIDVSKYDSPSWQLSYDYDHLTNMVLFYQEGGVYHRIELDNSKLYDGRQFRVKGFIFDLPNNGALANYYIRLEPKSRYFKVAFSFSGIKGTIESVHSEQLLYGFFFGGLITIFLYNFAIYFFLRDRAYLYYVYYIGFFVLVFMQIYGYTEIAFHANYLTSQLFAFFGYLSVHGMVLFSRTFLSLKNSAPRIDVVLMVLQWVIFISAPLVFLMPVGTPFKYLNYLIVLSVPAAVFAGYYRWRRQGYSPAGIYFAGWSVFASGLVLLSLRSIGLVPSNWFTDHAVMFASMVEAAAFSLALAYRIKVTEQQKNEALEGARADLELRVAERTESLNAALAARSMIVANASHELRTPVNNLKLLLATVGVAGLEQPRTVFAEVLKIARHLGQLVSNLLLLDGDPSAPPKSGVTEDFDLGEEISETVSLVGRQGTNNAEFTIDVDDCKGVMVQGDLTGLRRILVNLLSNAFKFTPQTGEVVLSAQQFTDTDGGIVKVKIIVSDTGCGIPENMYERIFTPFVTSGALGNHPGTGLGLSIAKQLAINLGGSLVLVKSVVDEGSVFEVHLQFSLVQRQSEKLDISESKTTQKRLRILLAEDDPIAAGALRTIITNLRHDVTCVTTFDDLCKSLSSRFDIDVAIIDHRLPGGYGLDAVKIARNAGSKGIFVLMTADVTPSVLDSANILCDHVMTKPIETSRLRRLLGEAPVERVLDPEPLRALCESADKEKVLKLTERFFSFFDEQLQNVRSIFESPIKSEELEFIIHRLSSSCRTIGAIFLMAELKRLIDCKNLDEAMEQWPRILLAREETSASIASLLYDY